MHITLLSAKTCKKHPGLDFIYGIYGFKIRHFVRIAKVPNLSHYTMVLNLQRVTENDNMILLQNEDCFFCSSSWSYLKEKLHYYKMKIGFIIKLLKGDTPPLQNED